MIVIIGRATFAFNTLPLLTVKSFYNDIGINDTRVTTIFLDEPDRDYFAGNHY